MYDVINGCNRYVPSHLDAPASGLSMSIIGFLVEYQAQSRDPPRPSRPDLRRRGGASRATFQNCHGRNDTPK